jgi:SAM-dependent methyltransferase
MPNSEISGTGMEMELEVPAQAIAESFSAEWHYHDHGRSRTWHETVQDRCQLFLTEVGCRAEDLAGKLVFDAGCGNGSLSEGISGFGCEVLAVDVSAGVEEAYRYFLQQGRGRTHFVQGDLMNPPVRSDCVDILYSSGVLHHNPDTREALNAIAKTVKPGGRIYIWVYHREPGLKFKLQLKLRSALSRMPGPLKRAFVYVWSIQSMVRQHIRTLLRLNDEKDRLSWRERMVDLLDIYTPRYRWMHTQEEVHGWYRDLGLRQIRTTEVRRWGFGVLGIDAREGPH